MSSVLIKGRAFEECVRLAFELYERRLPLEYRAFCETVREIRAGITNNGTTKTGALRERGLRPVFVDRVLQMHPEDSMRKYGVRCGTGDPDWYMKAANLEVYYRVAKVAATTSDSSPFSARGMD